MKLEARKTPECSCACLRRLGKLRKMLNTPNDLLVASIFGWSFSILLPVVISMVKIMIRSASPDECKMIPILAPLNM